MNVAAMDTLSQTEVERHTLAQSLMFHLAPGIAMMLVFIILASVTAPLGWPPSLALLVTWLIAGLPILLGILFAQGRRRNGTSALKGILLFREPLPTRQYVWLVLALLVWTLLASTLFFTIGESIRLGLFANWPEWLNLAALARDPARYSPSMLWIIVALSAVLNITVPIVEELYFRSFLLPRLPVAPRWAPFVNAALFSLYHLWLPWDFFGRLVALLPVVYVVQWKHNVYVSILVHCLLNLTGTLGLAALVMTMG